MHRTLFDGLYPWAGKDRAEVLPDSAIKKGTLYFCHPRDCRLAVSEGLFLAQDKKLMNQRPGFIMGMFAYGHPFFDGNGRTMLLVHAELCFRANMSVNWMRTSKQQYLDALTKEIETPNDGHLDTYLKPFIEPQIPRESWLQSVSAIPGLDGIDAQSDVSAGYIATLRSQGNIRSSSAAALISWTTNARVDQLTPQSLSKIGKIANAWHLR